MPNMPYVATEYDLPAWLRQRADHSELGVDTRRRRADTFDEPRRTYEHQRADLKAVEVSEWRTAAEQIEVLLERQADRRRQLRDGFLEAHPGGLDD